MPSSQDSCIRLKAHLSAVSATNLTLPQQELAHPNRTTRSGGTVEQQLAPAVADTRYLMHHAPDRPTDRPGPQKQLPCTTRPTDRPTDVRPTGVAKTATAATTVPRVLAPACL